MADRSRDLLVGLDVGSSKVVCIAASSISPSTFKIEGLGECRSTGIRDGSVVDIQEAVNSIRMAVEEASQTAQTNIRQIAAGISGLHIRSDNINQQLIVNSSEIQEADVQELLAKAQVTTLPPSMRYLDVFATEYCVDFTWGIESPIGMEGRKLEAKLHMITAQTGPCMNLNKAIRRSGLELIDSQLIFNPLAAAAAVLTPEEKRLGVALIDIGSDLTDIAVFSNGTIQYSGVAGFGGQKITDDLAIKTHLSLDAAEALKQNYGVVKFDPSLDRDQSFQLPPYPGIGQDRARILTSQALSDIINISVQEMFENVYYKIRDRGLLAQLGHGVVITGGGANLRGIERMAREVFSLHLAGREINVRRGFPIVNAENGEFIAPDQYNKVEPFSKIAGYATPEHATVMGYLQMLNANSYRAGLGNTTKGRFKSLSDRLKTWFLGNF